MRTFEELECWKKAAALRRKVSALAKKLPAEEKFRLKDQLIRSSRSGPAALAEGYGRFHYQENIQYCRTARGSIFEVLDHLIVCNEEGYINEVELAEYRQEISEVQAVLNGYINYLIRAKDTTGKVEEDAEPYGSHTINY